jgi:putative ABC transport system permease protein
MEIGALNRFMRESKLVSGVYLLTDREENMSIFRKLRDTPRVAGTVLRHTEIVNMNIVMNRLIIFFTMITMLLGIGVTFGVIYNSARIALSERGRELASMRVLGFTRQEITWILMGEFGLLTLLAIPLGFLFGYGFCRIMTYNLQSDLFRVPLILKDTSYAFSALVVIIGAIFSVYLIARKLKCLDLIGVLKTRE